MAIAFNAGIWGYDLWKPTLAALCRFHRPVPFVVTAYTVQEAEEDAEVIVEVVGVDRSGTVDGMCLWKVEVNPFGSRKERKTSTAPKERQYFENNSWQAWLLGGGQKRG